MHRTIQYIILFAALMLLQSFMFDNLALSSNFNPMIYIVFIIMLPIESLPVVVLLSGLLLGISADLLTGGDGLNTAATLPAAFLRQPLLSHLCDRDDLRDGGFPSAQRLGNGWRFVRLAVAVILVHHSLFFVLESPSWVQMPLVLQRIVLSGGFTLMFAWLTARLFNHYARVR